MKVKVCGMKISSNIQDVISLKPDFMGFIFYPQSPRFSPSLDADVLGQFPKQIQKIGVFVNQSIEIILSTVHKYKLDGVQLHGDEQVKECNLLKSSGLLVIKAFPISDSSSFKLCSVYEGACDYFLFDTKTDAYGGSGVKFDWEILNEYSGETEFFLSGGIAAEDRKSIAEMNHPKLAGIDLNSKFEISPGNKNIGLLKSFLKEIKIL